MEMKEFRRLTEEAAPPEGMAAPLAALWWDAKGEWARAHGLVDALGTPDGMAVHAYLHRREGDEGNAAYWYRRAGSESRRETLEAEWAVLVERLLAKA